MASFLAQRFGILLATLVAASILIFVFTEILPGDPASFMLGLNAEPDTLNAVRHALGLDLPPLERYFAWLAGLVHGDFGISYTYRVPVAELIADRLWVSLPLAVFALALSIVIGLPLGVVAATGRHSPADVAVLGITQVGIAVPNFWFAMLMVLLFSVTLHWFSAGGFPGWNGGILPGLRALLLPALALALPEASILARVTRSSLLDTLGEDYVRTARAKGLTRAAAIRRHALRNALIPVTTIVGLQFSFLLAGAIVIENVFFLPGLGRLIYQAVTQRDLIVVQSVVLLLVAAVVAVTFAVDVAYALIDPRLRRASA